MQKNTGATQIWHTTYYDSVVEEIKRYQQCIITLAPEDATARTYSRPHSSVSFDEVTAEMSFRIIYFDQRKWKGFGGPKFNLLFKIRDVAYSSNQIPGRW